MLRAERKALAVLASAAAVLIVCGAGMGLLIGWLLWGRS
jgi:hypothetical protein